MHSKLSGEIYKNFLFLSLLCLQILLPSIAASQVLGWSSYSEMLQRYDTAGQIIISDEHHHAYLNKHLIPEAHEKILALGGGVHNSNGAIWSKQPIGTESWQATVTFSIHGDHETLGGDGLAFWATDLSGNKQNMGSVFGAPDNWRGLGILLDTYDDDSRGNNPAIMGIMGDGTQSYRKYQDGEGQYFAGCLRPLRNQAHPVAMRVSYQQGSLKVELADTDSMHYATCFEHENIKIPPHYHLGLSASTNDHPDTIQVLKMIVEPLYSSPNSSLNSQSINSQSTRSNDHFVGTQNTNQNGQQHWSSNNAGGVYQNHHVNQPNGDNHQINNNPSAHNNAYNFEGASKNTPTSLLGNHEEHLVDLKAHVGNLSAGIASISNQMQNKDDLNSQLAHSMHANIENLRAELLQHIQHVQQHLETHDSIRAPPVLGTDKHNNFGGAKKSHMNIYFFIFGCQIFLLCGFLFIKSQMERSREKERKWI